MPLPKFEEFNEEELKQLGEGTDEQQEDDDLPQNLDEDDGSESEEGSEEEGEENEEGAEEGEEEDQENEGEEELVEADGDAPVADKNGKVNIGALHQERGKRKQIESNYQALQENFARLEQRTNMILQKMLQGEQAEEEEVIPDKAADPIGYMEYQDKRIAALEGRGKQQETQSEQQRQVQDLVNTGTALANEVRTKDPELYDGSLQFVISRRSAELRALGSVREQDIPDIINNEMTAGMINALKQRQNPGDFLLKYAKAGGYVHKAAPKLDKDGKAIVPKGKPTLQQLQANKGKNKTLGGSGARLDAAGDGLASKLASMNDAEFSAWYAKNSKGGKNKEFAKAFAG